MSRAAVGYATDPLALLALVALAIVGVWRWLGAPVALPASPLAPGEKLYCVSYAPFRGSQDPLVEGTRVEAAQIDEDLALLSKYANCVRTYSVGNGVDQVPQIARRYGLKVLQGLWLSGEPDKNRQEVAATVALAKQFPDVISGVIVGNEVLLRGDMTVTDLIATIREVKAQVPEPVTYADVWEYWLRFRDVQSAVDFVTIHILPYWEDFPIPAAQAAVHVDEIRKKVAAAIPNKEIVIGEFGWPSAGRMREGARPSPSNQALAIEATLALAKRENLRVNIIEAFDQPWKRWLEGAVGGEWGIFDRAMQGPKFTFGGAVSDHPHWLIEALAGVLLAAASFGAAMFGAGWPAGGRKEKPHLLWPKVAVLSFLPAVMFGWTIERVPLESFSIGGWLRSLAFVGVAVVGPIVCAWACAHKRALPVFSALLGGGAAGERRDALTLVMGATFIAVVVLSTQAALGLMFDPRYRDIPFAPQTGAFWPFLVLGCTTMPAIGAGAAGASARTMAERVAALILALCAVYIVLNETFANWQAVWFAAGLLGLAVTLALVRGGPGSE